MDRNPRVLAAVESEAGALNEHRYLNLVLNLPGSSIEEFFKLLYKNHAMPSQIIVEIYGFNPNFLNPPALTGVVLLRSYTLNGGI